MAYLFFGIFIGWLIFGDGPSLDAGALTERESYAVLGMYGAAALIGGIAGFGIFPPTSLILLTSALASLGGAVGYWWGEAATGFAVGMLLAAIVFVAVFIIAYVQARREGRELEKRMEERRTGG